MQVLLNHGVGSVADPRLDDLARDALLYQVRHTPMPESVHAGLLDAQLLEQRMKMSTQEGRVPNGIERNGHYASSIRDPEAYLLVAFQHRFRRFQKGERTRRERFQSASADVDLGVVERARDATWILELERAITVRQITDRMDPWTKKAWQARQFGYSWKEIAGRSGLSEQAAKKKFEYGLEKTRQRIVGLLKTRKAKESA